MIAASNAIDWRLASKVPACVAAMLAALRFDGRQTEWPVASPHEWDGAIYYLNRNQLTLIVRHVSAPQLPAHLCARFDQFFDANRARLTRLRADTSEVINALDRAGIETLLLKGFARADEYVPDPDARMHYDVDLYCPEQSGRAHNVLAKLGYQSLPGTESDAASHTAPMARPSTWKWRDDFFDLETPVHVELHHSFWVPQIERFSFSGLDQFWVRREKIPLRGVDSCSTMSRHDTLAYRCLHLLRHLLRGDTRAAGVYEIAWFLHSNRLDDDFWRTWQALHSPDLRRGQAVCFSLAQSWFGCRPHDIPALAAETLPNRIRDWMERSSASPVQSFFSPAKDELALHFALLDSNSARLQVAARRLFPLRCTPQMWEDPQAYLARLRSRLIFHARALAPALSKLPIIRR